MEWCFDSGHGGALASGLFRFEVLLEAGFPGWAGRGSNYLIGGRAFQILWLQGQNRVEVLLPWD